MAKGMKRRKIRAGDLFKDEELLKLRPLNEGVISRYRQVYRVFTMPPPIVNQEGMIIVSGNHRHEAFLREKGKDAKIGVILREFKDRKEVLKFFAKENASHGYMMDGITRKRVALALVEHGISIEETAKIINFPEARITKWLNEKICVIGDGNKVSYYAPVKRGVPLGEVKEMTERQYQEHIKADRGVPILSLMKQLIRYLQNGWVPYTEDNIAVIRKLNALLIEFLKRVPEDM